MAVAPVNIRFPAQNITDVSFAVQWDAVINQSVNRYIVSVYWTSDLNPIKTVTADETSYTVTGLTPNTTYIVTVAAVDESDCTGVASVGEEVTTEVSDNTYTANVSLSINPMDTTSKTGVSVIPNIMPTVTTGITDNSVADIINATVNSTAILVSTTIMTITTLTPTVNAINPIGTTGKSASISTSVC